MTEDVKRATAAARRKAEAKETLEQGFERLSRECKFADRDVELFALAKEALLSGEIKREGSAKLTKTEVLNVGEAVKERRNVATREARIARTLSTKPDNYHIITKDSDLGYMMERLHEEARLQTDDPWFRKVFTLFNNTLIRRKLLTRDIEIPLVQSFTAWDTETSGLDKRIDLTGGYSFWLPLLDEGYYVAYGHLTGEKQCTRSEAIEAIRTFIEDAAHIKSYHNAPFDLEMHMNDGLKPQGVRYDSRDAQFILNDQEETYSLKPLVTKYKSVMGVDFDDFTFEDLFGNGSPMPYPIEVVGIYAIKDTHKGWTLTKWQIDMMLARDNLYVPYFEIRQYLPEVNVNIERTGFEVDLAELKALGDEYRPKRDKAKADIFETYQIDADFLHAMSMSLKGDQIREWCEKQKARIEKQAEMLRKCREEIATANPVTKKYADLQRRIRNYETETLAAPIPQNAPDYIREFNLDSDEHLAYLIYDHLGIKDRTGDIDKDKKKRRGTSKDVLAVYFDEEPSLKPLATYSMFNTLLGTFIDKIPEAIDSDGRLHTQFRTVSTGRYGSSGYSGKPNELRAGEVNDDNFLDVMAKLVAYDGKVSKGTNIQNIPSRNEEGVRVRKTFKPRTGYTFIGSDLGSIEPRLQAHRMAVEFGDEIFAEMFRQNLDPYVEFASILFEVEKELCLEKSYKALKGTPDAVPPYRKIMKQLFLARGYGQNFEQFYKTVIPFGITEEHALRAYKKFDEVLPGFKCMVESTFEHLREHGWVATIFHQKRRFPQYKSQWKRLCQLMRKAGIRDKNDPELSKKSRKLKRDECTEFWNLIRETGRAERQAFNHTIQGSGAQILQFSMIRSYYECTLARGWEFNLTLHDEQKHSVPNEQLTPEAVELYNDIMTNTVELALPLASDTVIEPCWMNEYSPTEWFAQKFDSKADPDAA